MWIQSTRPFPLSLFAECVDLMFHATGIMRYKVIVCYNKDEENFLTFGSIQIYVDLSTKHGEDIF